MNQRPPIIKSNAGSPSQSPFSGGRLPPEWLADLKSKVNLIDVISEQVNLKKSGSNWSGLCPFHSERSPSFSASETKQLYHCYGCKEGGDLVSFVMKAHSLSFPEAIEELAERAHLKLPQGFRSPAGADPEKNAIQNEKQKTAFRLNRFVAAYFRNQLGRQPEIRDYFERRGLRKPEAGDGLAQDFYLGAAPAGWDGLSLFLAEKKAPIELATELGLVKPSTAAGRTGTFDLFRNRAMFPILDIRGRVLGFGGRALSKDEEGPKYLNSSESLIFHKSKVLYGLFQAQKHIRELNQVVVVEGYFDVLAMHAAGFKNTVATCGTALTADHLKVLARLCDRIVVLFDRDRAGIAATERAMEAGLDQGLVLYGASVSGDAKDPDELLLDPLTGQILESGRLAMQTALEQAQPILDLRLEQAMVEGATGPEALTQAIKQVAAWLSRFQDPIGRDVRAQQFCERMKVSTALLGLPRSSVTSQSGSGIAPSGGGGPRSNHAPSIRPQASRPANTGAFRLRRSERILIRSLIQEGGIAAQAGGDLSRLLQTWCEKLPKTMTLADGFEHPWVADWLGRCLGEGLSGPWKTPDFAPLMIWEQVSQELDLESQNPRQVAQVRSILTEAAVQGDQQTESTPEGNDLDGALARIVARVWARFSQRVKMSLEEAEAKKDANLHAHWMQEYLDVQRRLKEFNRFYDEA
jgi:DNA primase